MKMRLLWPLPCVTSLRRKTESNSSNDITKRQLTAELAVLRERVAGLETAETERRT